MFNIEALRDLWSHMEWADAEVWATILDADPTPTDPLMRDKLVHIHMTQRAYLNMWLDRPQQAVRATDFDMSVTLRNWASPVYAEGQQLLARIDSVALSAPASELYHERLERHLGPPHSRVTLRDTIVDVVSHTGHHRGQMCTRLRELDIVPPPVEYIAWIWRGRPVANWGNP